VSARLKREREERALKRAQEELRRANLELESRVDRRTAELQAANKELEAFAYSVSHDLRAPLRSIDGFSLALIEDCEDKLDEQGKDHLRRVRAAAQRMGRLIDDMLTLSRVTRSGLVRKKVDLSELAHMITRDFRKSQFDRDVEFTVQDGLAVSGDARLLHIMMENLLANAWKFTSKKPASKIAFGAEPRGEEKVFFVRDNGAGFDMRYADKLFGVFQRLHKAAEFPGTGIGLATVQRIVDRHGGRVWAESSPGKGAAFYFTLPAQGGET
ncbi:ATP-binding protein, partial [Elusimicrobiota bacterium]